MNLDLFRNRNFALLWLAQVVSKLGDVFFNVAIMVTIFQQTGSALQTAGVMIANALPAFLLGPVAGVLVDRYPRKWVMVAMDLLRAVLLGILLLVARGGRLEIWATYALVAGLAAAGTFYQPARLAIVPSLVRKEDLVRANSLVMTTNQAALALGYAVGGLLVLTLTFETMVVINLASYALAAGAVALIAVQRRSVEERRPAARMPLHKAVAEGMAYLRKHTLARPLVTMEVLEHFPHAIWTSALMLAFTTQALGAGPEFWGYQSAIFYGGQLVGAMMAAIVADRLARRAGWAIVGNAFLFSALTVSYALSPSLAFTLILCFFFGPTSAMRDVAQDSLLQAEVAPGVMGRIYATRNMFASLTWMLAGIGFAWMADNVDVRWVYLIGGFMYLGTALFAYGSRAIRTSRIVDNPDGSAVGGELPVSG